MIKLESSAHPCDSNFLCFMRRSTIATGTKGNKVGMKRDLRDNESYEEIMMGMV